MIKSANHRKQSGAGGTGYWESNNGKTNEAILPVLRESMRKQFSLLHGAENLFIKSLLQTSKHIKDFVFADVEPEYQDAFGETSGYHPRQPKKKTAPQDWEQMELQL